VTGHAVPSQHGKEQARQSRSMEKPVVSTKDFPAIHSGFQQME